MTDKDIDKENYDLVIKRKEEATRVSEGFPLNSSLPSLAFFTSLKLMYLDDSLRKKSCT